MVLMACDRQAAALGFAPGMKLADARARVPELQVFHHAPLADARLLGQLADACQRYTPMVAMVAPHALILDISGAAHFFANEKALAEDAEDRFASIGFSVSWALADSADAALALVRHGLKEGAEARLPVAALDMDEKTHRALERAGLYHIGDLAARPRSGLAARFGEELILRLDRLLGREDRPLDPMHTLGNIVSERRFAEPLTQGDVAQQILMELFAEAAIQLEERGQGARMAVMQLFRCDGDIARLTIEMAAATRDARLFGRLLAERMETLNDPLNPGFGYDSIRLTITVAETMENEQLRLEGGADRHRDEMALINQLSVRLGRRRVQRFQAADSHIPEQGLLALPALDKPAPDKKAPTSWQKPAYGEPPTRPIYLFDPPQLVQVIAEVPDGPPHRFTWRRDTYRVTRYEGPERIASEWWRRTAGHESGKGGLTRDYYRVEDEQGHRYWLFRHGLYGREKGNPDWYIHGLFA